MRVLVTGAEGYIGSQLVPVLERRGHQVVGLDTGFYSDSSLFEAPSSETVCIRKDIRRVTEDDLVGFDAVVHLGELSNDPLGELNPKLTDRINHQGSVHLARKARAAGVSRFVYSSSCSVYGLGHSDFRSEDDEPNPQTSYAVCKVLVEKEVSELADDVFCPTYLRNATVYGPSPRMRFDLVLNNLAGLAWTTGEIRMTSDGTPWRPLVHVLDVCDAMACVLEAPCATVHNQVFNVGDSRENYQVRDVAQIVADAFPGCSLTVGSSGGDHRSYRVSFDKINRELPGFECIRSAVTGADQLHSLFEKIGLTKSDFEFRSWTRLKQLQYLMRTGMVDEDLYWQ